LGIAFSVSILRLLDLSKVLGEDIEKAGSLDHVMSDLIDKILLPQLAREDRARENDFYERKGIQRKVSLSTPPS
jgi:hypothetical protein